jgi:hypothetical protein
VTCPSNSNSSVIVDYYTNDVACGGPYTTTNVSLVASSGAYTCNNVSCELADVILFLHVLLSPWLIFYYIKII